MSTASSIAAYAGKPSEAPRDRMVGSKLLRHNDSKFKVSYRVSHTLSPGHICVCTICTYVLYVKTAHRKLSLVKFFG